MATRLIHTCDGCDNELDDADALQVELMHGAGLVVRIKTGGTLAPGIKLLFCVACATQRFAGVAHLESFHVDLKNRPPPLSPSCEHCGHKLGFHGEPCGQ